MIEADAQQNLQNFIKAFDYSKQERFQWKVWLCWILPAAGSQTSWL
jgi:hypothetical protein